MMKIVTHCVIHSDAMSDFSEWLIFQKSTQNCPTTAAQREPRSKNAGLNGKGFTDYSMSVQELDQTADEILMKRYGKGNARAFELLYQRHKGPLFRFILRQVSDRSATEELFQDVWSRVISQRRDYHVSAKFTTWLYTIARHRVIDYHRVTGKRLGMTESHDSDELEPLDNDGFVCEQRPELILESEKSLEKIRELVAGLPPSQREAFVLKYDAGFNHHDIAEITGQKEETIKSQIRYAIGKLKQGMFGGRDDQET